jgi:hypothetical protein
MLGEQWLPLARVLRFIIKDRPTEENLTMRLYGPQFEELEDNRGGPIVTVRKTYDGGYVVTMSANVEVNPPLDWNQFKMMQFLGFDPPRGFDKEFAVDPRKQGSNTYPYFNAVLNDSPSVAKTIELILVALVCVYGCDEEAQFFFGTDIELTRAIHNLDLLDRYKARPENPKAELFGFKGAH